MTCEDAKHDNMIESWHYSLNMSKGMCVCASYVKVCKLGQNVKTHNHMMFQKQRNMIFPTIFVLNEVQRNTQNI